jgi:nucleoside-diphosphate-sugar epimerase
MSDARSVLVTGGNGFIGGHVVHALVAMGHAVTVLQRSDRIAAGICDILRVDQLTPDAIGSALSGRRFDWVVHLAAYGVSPLDRDREPMLRINVEVTRRLTEIAAGWPARAMFVAGSGAEYASSGLARPFREHDRLETLKLYGASKAAGTLCALALANERRLPLAVGRVFGVYGPGEAPHRLLPALFEGLRMRLRVPLTSGTQRRDFLYVADVVEAILALLGTLEKDPRQTVLNVASGAPVSVQAFAEAVARQLEAPGHLLGFGDLPMRPDELAHFSGEPAAMFAFTGWTPRHSLTEGIALSVRRLEQKRQP